MELINGLLNALSNLVNQDHLTESEQAPPEIDWDDDECFDYLIDLVKEGKLYPDKEEK